jgi:succinate-semialdehyde dehydrogenase/glutarate-semialdehyde dehydrogenase
MEFDMYPELKLLLGGHSIVARERDGEDVINPATGLVLGHLPHATPADLDEALAHAQKGFLVWRATSPFERANSMRRASDLIRERSDAIAKMMTLEQGKPLRESQGELVLSTDTLDWLADEGRRSYGRVIPSRVAHGRVMVLQEAIGPVAAFTPWNFPALTTLRKIGGALAAGCSIILKAAEETPATALAIADAFHDAGVPKDVLQLVYGVPHQVSRHLIASDVIRKVSFTGSVPVGICLAKLAAEGMKRATMELGGHAPVIIFADADIDLAVRLAAPAKFRNAGQVCVTPTRFLVQDKVHDEFLDKLVRFTAQIQVGDGLDEKTTMGPLANVRRLDAIQSLVADARDRGAQIVFGGERLGNQGFFHAPTVIAGLDDEARVMREEPFGPVAPVSRFADFDEAVSRANALKVGLSAYAFTRSDYTARAIGDQLEAGMVAINNVTVSLPEAPFGGIKYSGDGHEGGIEGVEVYMTKKLIVHN